MAEYIDKKDLEEYIELGYSAKQILSLFDVGECPYADVVEREKIDKAIEEAIPLDVIISCKQELITKIIEYSGSGNKVREEIWKNCYEYSGSGEETIQAYYAGFKKSLEILDKLIESEGVRNGK